MGTEKKIFCQIHPVELKGEGCPVCEGKKSGDKIQLQPTSLLKVLTEKKKKKRKF